MPRSTEITDPRALRALAHPTRLALLALLRRDGPQTATSAGARLGESSGSTSFHLRQLARHGLVEETGDGSGRSKPWRATADYTSWPSVAADPELAAAGAMLSEVVVEGYVRDLRDWVARRPAEPEEWQRAAELNDDLVHLTAAELAALNARTWALATATQAERRDPARRPPGARPVRYVQVAFPLAREADARA